MHVFVNGEPYESESGTLAALLVECEFEANAVATAINKGFVRLKDRAAIRLREGDQVEILTPRQGG
jgi:sulfur carrier protein